MIAWIGLLAITTWMLNGLPLSVDTVHVRPCIEGLAGQSGCLTTTAGLGEVEPSMELGRRVFHGEEPGVNCTACHARDGHGDVGPSLSTVLDTFPRCLDQLAWISLGSAHWPFPTYGDTDRPVQGGMPGFGLRDDDHFDPGIYEASVTQHAPRPWVMTSVHEVPTPWLTSEQLTSVATYTRVAFGGAPLEMALRDCRDADVGPVIEELMQLATAQES